MADAKTKLVKMNKMATKFEYSFLAFPDQLQTHAAVTTSTCFVRSIREKRSHTKK